MKTAEEIIISIAGKRYVDNNAVTTSECIKAMESYASQFKSPYPKMMMVWDYEEKQALKREVIAEYYGSFIAIDPDKYGTHAAWLHAKDI